MAFGSGHRGHPVARQLMMSGVTTIMPNASPCHHVHALMKIAGWESPWISASDVTPMPAATAALTAHAMTNLRTCCPLPNGPLAAWRRISAAARRASRVLPVPIRNASSGSPWMERLVRRGPEPDAGPDARSNEQHGREGDARWRPHRGRVTRWNGEQQRKLRRREIHRGQQAHLAQLGEAAGECGGSQDEAVRNGQGDATTSTSEGSREAGGDEEVYRTGR